MGVTRLHVAEARRVYADNRPYLEVTLANWSASPVGPGGLRLLVASSYGTSFGMSLSNHWTIGTGGSVFLATFLPNEGLKHIDFVDYIGFDGSVHAIGDRLSIGWFSNDLQRGTTGADVQA